MGTGETVLISEIKLYSFQLSCVTRLKVWSLNYQFSFTIGLSEYNSLLINNRYLWIKLSIFTPLNSSCISQDFAYSFDSYSCNVVQVVRHIPLLF